LPLIDYNGLTRGGPTGGASPVQTNTKNGKRSGTYHAHLEPAMQRPNLKVITGACTTRVVLEGQRAVGAEYRLSTGETTVVKASKEVVLSCGAFGSPTILLRSGIGPKAELEKMGVACVLDSPHVGKHLKDHIMCMFLYPAPEMGTSMLDLGTALGPDALRGAGVLPANPKDDAALPAELKALKAESERQLTEFAVEGKGAVVSSMYDGIAFYNTGLGDAHTHDSQIGILNSGFNADTWEAIFSTDIDKHFGSREAADEILGPTSQRYDYGQPCAAPQRGAGVACLLRPARPAGDPHELPLGPTRHESLQVGGPPHP